MKINCIDKQSQEKVPTRFDFGLWPGVSGPRQIQHWWIVPSPKLLFNLGGGGGAEEGQGLGFWMMMN